MVGDCKIIINVVLNLLDLMGFGFDLTVISGLKDSFDNSPPL